GLYVVSSHNTISGLRVHQFPLGIALQAGDFPTPGTPGTVEHNTVKNNIVADSSFVGIAALTAPLTGGAPGSVLAHTTITGNLAEQNGLLGIVVGANGADTQITHTTITGNEVRENGFDGLLIQSSGDHNVLSNVTLARNTAARNGEIGIIAIGGGGGAD